MDKIKISKGSNVLVKLFGEDEWIDFEVFRFIRESEKEFKDQWAIEGWNMKTDKSTIITLSEIESMKRR